MRRRASIVACSAVLLAAACGGNSNAPQPTAAVEKSSAIAAGDAICKQLTADVAQLVKNFKSTHPKPTDAEARDFLINTLLPRVDDADGAMHRIGEPTKDRAGFDAAVLALDKDVSDLKTAVGNDPQKVLAAPIVVVNDSAHLFTSYGFKECGKPSP